MHTIIFFRSWFSGEDKEKAEKKGLIFRRKREIIVSESKSEKM